MPYDIEFFRNWSKKYEKPDGNRAVAVFLPNLDYIKYPDYPDGCCVRCGKKLTGRRWRYCSDECNKIYYRTSKPDMPIYWNEFRRLILKRDKYTCVMCGDPGNDVHHILPIYLGGRQFDPDNCETLCGRHHKFKHAKRCADHPAQTRFDIGGS